MVNQPRQTEWAGLMAYPDIRRRRGISGRITLNQEGPASAVSAQIVNSFCDSETVWTGDFMAEAQHGADDHCAMQPLHGSRSIEVIVIKIVPARRGPELEGLGGQGGNRPAC